MTKTKLSVTINGRVFTRATDHAYTHVVVGPPGKTFERAIEEAETGGIWGAYWDRKHELATADPASVLSPSARRFLAGNPDREAYVATQRAYTVGQVRKANAKGFYGWQPYSWHQGIANAHKGLGKALQHTAGCRVVPVGTEIRI